MKRERVIQIEPAWNLSLVGWAMKQVVRNAWRFDTVFDPEDFEQEAYLMYLKLKQRYIVRTQSQFQRLFMRAWTNRLHEIAIECKRGWRLSWEASEDEADRDFFDSIVGSIGTEDIMVMRLLMDEAPAPVGHILDALGMNGEGVAERRTVCRRYLAGGRETLVAALQRLARVKDDYPIVEVIERWIKGVNQCVSLQA